MTGVPASEPETVVLKWLENAGWETQIGQAIILIDPFLTRGEVNLGAEWTTTNIALTAGVDRSQLVTISGRERLDFHDFSVQVIESQHGGVRRSGRIRRSKFEEATKTLGRTSQGRRFWSREDVISTTSP